MIDDVSRGNNQQSGQVQSVRHDFRWSTEVESTNAHDVLE